MATRMSSTVVASVRDAPQDPAREKVSNSASSSTLVIPKTASPSELSLYFSQSQLALALAIQKSKPEGLSTNDYCTQLRASIQKGRGSSAAVHRHIDTAEFWKEQYSKIHIEKKGLEEKIQCLEEQQSQEQAADNGNNLHSALEISSKRQAPSQDIEAWLDDQGNPDFANQVLLQRISSFILRIARCRNTLDKRVKETNAPNHLEDLLKSSVQVLALLDIVVSDCCIPLCNVRCSDDARILALFQQLMHQIVLGFRSSFDSLSELCRTILGRKKRFEIVHRLVMFTHKALNHLRTLCTIQAENEFADSRQTRHKRVRMDDEYAANKYMATMLVSVVQMDWQATHIGHSEILEGMLFSVLDNTGRLLSNAVFKEHVAVSDRVGNITKGFPALLPVAAKLEAQYILPILHAALGRTSARKELVARVLAEKAPSLTPQKSALPSDETQDLLGKAKKRIQSSLLKSAVGGHGLAALRLPPPPEEEACIALDIDAGVEKYGPEWLLESIWAVVGWELAVQ